MFIGIKSILNQAVGSLVIASCVALLYVRKIIKLYRSEYFNRRGAKTQRLISLRLPAFAVCILVHQSSERSSVRSRNEFGPESFRDPTLRLNVAMKEEL